MKRLAGHIRDYLKGRCTDDEVYQVETMSRLIDGDFTAAMTYGEIMKHGDFGLGTFVDLDGEMAAADGRFHHFGPDGTGTPVDPATSAPFAVVKHFHSDIRFRLAGPCDAAGLQRAVDAHLPVPDALCAIKASGRFRTASFRVMRRQESPTTLEGASRTQAQNDAMDLDGQLVGFRFPSDSAPVGVPGYHLHLIAAAGRLGGHFFDGSMTDVTVEIDLADHLQLAAAGGMLRLRCGASRTTLEDIARIEGRRTR